MLDKDKIPKYSDCPFCLHPDPVSDVQFPSRRRFWSCNHCSLSWPDEPDQFESAAMILQLVSIHMDRIELHKEIKRSHEHELELEGGYKSPPITWPKGKTFHEAFFPDNPKPYDGPSRNNSIGLMRNFLPGQRRPIDTSIFDKRSHDFFYCRREW